MNEALVVAEYGPSWGAIGAFLFVVVVGMVAFLWGTRKARNHPDWFKEKIENPLDAAARDLAAKGWTPSQIDSVLTGWANRDLTAKASAAYGQIPPDIAEAINKAAEWLKANGPKA